jgi:hypothetical protein
MRHGRWISPLLGAALVATLALPAGAATARDQAILAAGVIRKPDVPKSWTSSKPSDFRSALKAASTCAPILAATNAAQKAPHKSSRVFTDPATAGFTNTQNQVYAFTTAADASVYLAAFQAPAGVACLQGLIQDAGTATGAPPPQVSAGPLTNLQNLGNQAVGSEGTLPLTVQGQTLNEIFDLIAVREGRSVVVFLFGSPDVQIAQGGSIVRSVLSRLQRVGA